jgi:hypothetical protein
MKNLFLIISIISVFSSNIAAKNEIGFDDNLSVIQKALAEGDANTLSNYFDATLEITLLDKQDVLDKTKATETLRNFFAKNKPRAYNAVHQGSSKGSSSHYTIGDMQTSGGNFRVYIYYKSSGNNVLIQEIRIEK